MPSSKSRMSLRKSARASSPSRMSVTSSSKKSRMSNSPRSSTPSLSKTSRASLKRASIPPANTSVVMNGKKIPMVTFLVGLVIQGLILYYLYNLEDADCNCIRDWRHNFCKLFAILVILVNLAAIFTGIYDNKMFAVLWGSASVVNAYAFFTYIGDLNATQCSCAVTKQPNLNSIMILFRWVELFLGILVFLSLVTILYTGVSA